MYSAFYNRIVFRCFTESEAQNLDPQVSTVARKNSLYEEETLSRTRHTRKNLSAESRLGKQREGERDRTERVKKGKERKHTNTPDLTY